MNTEIKMVLAIMEGSYGYSLDEKKNIGTLTFNGRYLLVKSESYEKAYVINEILNTDVDFDTVLKCKKILFNRDDVANKKNT